MKNSRGKSRDTHNLPPHKIKIAFFLSHPPSAHETALQPARHRGGKGPGRTPGRREGTGQGMARIGTGAISRTTMEEWEGGGAWGGGAMGRGLVDMPIFV